MKRFSLVLRRTHMFVALFLTPWLAMYALSTLVFNHFEMFEALVGDEMQQFQMESEQSWTQSFPEGSEAEDYAAAIRKHLQIRGNLNFQDSEDNRFVYLQNGNDVFTPRRITYVPAQQKLIVERMVLRVPNFLTRLHSRVGYQPKTNVRFAWAFSVDLTIAATVLWVFSGFWMWWELKVTRRWGIVFALVGPALFACIWLVG